MPVSTIPQGGLLLHRPDAEPSKQATTSAILFRLSESLLNDLKKAHKGQSGVQFVTGKTPKLRLGNRTIDLSLAPDSFRSELYASTSETDLSYSGIITHRAELDHGTSTSIDTAGTDAALATLKSSMASYAEEKRAKATTLASGVLPAPENRWDAAKRQKRGLLGIASDSRPLSPSVGAANLGKASTSTGKNDGTIRTSAMRTTAIHLLAMEPTSIDTISKKTHIPKDELETILQRVGQEIDGRWKLVDRVHKELDVWDFAYPTQDGRQRAIDSAIKAYDRLRVPKEDNLWQLLLPEVERGKGTVLSKLHLGSGRGLTPAGGQSPFPNSDGDGKASSATHTPRLGPSSGTPKVGAAKADMTKRLLAKDPKKARAAEEAKEKKRKDKEATASDREVKQPKKPTPASASSTKTSEKIKSTELVHSSEEDQEEGEVRESPTDKSPKPAENNLKPVAKARPKQARAPPSEDILSTVKPSKAAVRLAQRGSTPANKAAPSPAVKPSKSHAVGKATPQPSNGLSAPSSQHKSQLSPSKAHTRPTVPSPLGAARPRVASDVSDRSAIGVQRARQGADTPKGLGITNGLRKRHDTVTSTDSFASSNSDRKLTSDKAQQDRFKLTSNGRSTPKAAVTNGGSRKQEIGTKRKADDTNTSKEAPVSKQRKMESSSTKPDRPRNNHTTMPQTSPNISDSSSGSSLIETITFSQGITLGDKFRDYYPQYAKLFDELTLKQQRGETVSKEESEHLWQMHDRLKQMKKEIQAASKRQHD